LTAPLLGGLTVIDAASFIAGPVAATMLADLGARVIEVEPPDGDPYRHRTGGPGVPESPYNYRWIVGGYSCFLTNAWNSANRSSRYIVGRPPP
jgi:formyl-CoA transferase